MVTFGRRGDPVHPVLASGGTAARGAGATKRRLVDPRVAQRLLQPAIARHFDPADCARRRRGELASMIGTVVDNVLAENDYAVDEGQKRDLVTYFLDTLLSAGRLIDPEAARSDSHREGIPEQALRVVMPVLLERIDTTAVATMNRGELARHLRDVVGTILTEQAVALNAAETRNLITLLIDDMLGLGPLEPLLVDDSINDIVANGADQIYVERYGKLELSPARFRDNHHMMNVITRIVTTIGRRIDEASPLVDARLADGSRVNIIIPPLAIDGPAISIRKFAKRTIDLDRMAAQANMSSGMATLLKVAAACRLNILVSGGTGSGKTTLLNALSQLIDRDERIITIEDAAELQLQQPHVVRLETRPINLEGRGEINMRDLVRNALRMRPDRIILGEIRGHEALDMLQAMNTGHDGSLGTVHANSPREALTRLENMVAMAGFNLSTQAVRAQIAAAVHLVVQTARMRDGLRRITNITEIIGVEGTTILTHEIFTFEMVARQDEAGVSGKFVWSGVQPLFASRAANFGLSGTLAEALR